MKFLALISIPDGDKKRCEKKCYNTTKQVPIVGIICFCQCSSYLSFGMEGNETVGFCTMLTSFIHP